MKKSGSTWLVAAVLSCLLNLGASPAVAYYPPLQATGSGSGSGVSLSVTLPSGGGIYASAGYPPGITVSSFTQHNGVMAWIYGDGSTFSVSSCTYDPFLKTFIFGNQVGPYTEVNQLKVQDGVVAFVAKEVSNTYAKFFYSTYDPAKGAWQNQSCLPISPETSANHQVITKDGVLAFYYTAEIAGIHTYNLEADIYDPVKGQWFSEFTIYNQEKIFGPDGIAIGNVNIANATLSYDWYIPVGGPLHYTYGYDLDQHKWLIGDPWSPVSTKPGAYFVAQPSSGSSPLWVWFTDMSIAGSSWNWQFGDGSTGTNRSPYHTFTHKGEFQVSQQISGANGSDTFSRTITVDYPKLKVSPGIFHLLLHH